jgi:hypothetical protein
LPQFIDREIAPILDFKHSFILNRNSGVVIEVGSAKVRKKYPHQGGNVGVLHLQAIYKYLVRKSVPNVDQLAFSEPSQGARSLHQNCSCYSIFEGNAHWSTSGIPQGHPLVQRCPECPEPKEVVPYRLGRRFDSPNACSQPLKKHEALASSV